MIQTAGNTQIVHQHFEPTYKDSKVKSIWRRATSAFDTQLPLDFVVSGSRGTFRVVLDKEKARQDSDLGSIAYTGTSIHFRTKKGRKVVKDPRSSLPKVASKVGIDLDPGLRTWAFSLNPMEHLVGPGGTLRLNGAMVVSGVKCDLLELDSPGLKMNLVLRHKDGLPVKIFSEVVDSKGFTLSSSVRTFKYVSIRKEVPSKRFDL